MRFAILGGAMWLLPVVLALLPAPFQNLTHSSRTFGQPCHYRLFLPACATGTALPLRLSNPRSEAMRAVRVASEYPTVALRQSKAAVDEIPGPATAVPGLPAAPPPPASPPVHDSVGCAGG